MLLRRYRATGADLPFGDPARPHDGIRMEGWFWRLSCGRTGRVVLVLCGLHRDADGGRWANVALVGGTRAGPGAVRSADLPVGAEIVAGSPPAAGAVALRASDGRRGIVADADGVRVDLGPDARLDLRVRAARPWTRRAFGGVGIAHALPRVSQFWHPHVLGARASGRLELAGETVDLTGFDVYAEKNWSAHPGGFPREWWWGQAQHLGDADACVAFAGGPVSVGPLRLVATAVVVRLGDELVRLGDPVVSPAHAVVGGGRWTVRACGPRWSVALDGRADVGRAHVLPVPDPTRGCSRPGSVMDVAGELRIVVRRAGRVVLDATSDVAALEHGGRGAVVRHGAHAAVPGAPAAPYPSAAIARTVPDGASKETA